MYRDRAQSFSLHGSTVPLGSKSKGSDIKQKVVKIIFLSFIMPLPRLIF